MALTFSANAKGGIPIGANRPAILVLHIPNGVKINLSSNTMNNNGPVKNTNVPNKAPPMIGLKTDFVIFFIYFIVYNKEDELVLILL